MSVLDWLDDRREVVAERLARLRTGAPAPVSARRRTRASATIASVTGRSRVAWVAIDTVAALVLLVLVTIAWLPTFGNGWLWITSLGAGALGATVGIVAGLRHWDALRTAAATLGVYALTGTFLAMPTSALYGVIPTARSLQGLVLGPVLGWKAMLTVEPPIGETGYLLVPVVLVGMLAVLASVTVSLRSGRPSLAALPMVGALLLVFLLGVSTTYLPLVVGLAALFVVTVWTAYRRAQKRRSLVIGGSVVRWPQIAAGVVVLALVAGTAVAAEPLLETTEARHTVREVVTQPLDVHQYPSPLQGFRLNLTDNKQVTLFTVTGVPSGTRIRTASLDAYDGYTYTVSNSTASGADAGTFRRIGSRVTDDTVGTQVKASVTIGQLTGVWVPTVGQTEKISFGGTSGVGLDDSFYYNQSSGTGLVTTGLQQGDSYQVTAVVPNQPTKEQIAKASSGQISQPAADPIPDTVRDLAAKWAGLAPSSNAGALAQAFADNLHDLGYYSHGIDADETQSWAGHSAARITELLHDTTQMVGDEEQYSVALALLCRAAGIPARVGYGYVVSSDDGQVRGSDVTAWTEVYLSGYGWVVFNPTPDKSRRLAAITDEPQSVPKPQVENPPPPPPKSGSLDEDTTPPGSQSNVVEQKFQVDWKLVGTVALVGGIPLVFIVLPIALVVGLKMRRRRTRMGQQSLVARVSGGWSEVVDRARDLGKSPSPSATRTEQAQQLVATFGRVTEKADPRILARQADMTVFSPDTITPGQATTYWASVDEAIGGLNRSVSLLRRIQASLSVRSFRRYR